MRVYNYQCWSEVPTQNYLSVTNMKVQIKKSNAVQKYLPPILLRRQGKIVEESAAEYFAA